MQLSPGPRAGVSHSSASGGIHFSAPPRSLMTSTYSINRGTTFF